jgi:glucosamine 6-phosphate synthetase-like amidotransferase/phosphosugar isomerase protein
MCGICGFVNVMDEYKKRLLCFANLERGRQTSACLYDKDGELLVAKNLESISKTISDGLFGREIWQSRFMLFHNRNASTTLGTIGGNTIANAHPFECGNIIGAHNGYWSNYDELAKKHEVPKEHSIVDSNVAIYLIDKIGTSALSELCGVGAMWWIDKRLPDRFFLWNWKKELAISKYKNRFAFSSDINHLKMIVSNKWETTNLDSDVGQLLAISKTSGEVTERVDIKGTTAKTSVVHFNYGCGEDCDWERSDYVPHWQQTRDKRIKKRQDRIKTSPYTFCKCEIDKKMSQVGIYSECRFLLESTGSLYRCDGCGKYLYRTEIMNGGVIINSCSKCHRTAKFVTNDEVILAVASRLALLDAAYVGLVNTYIDENLDYESAIQLYEVAMLSQYENKEIVKTENWNEENQEEIPY